MHIGKLYWFMQRYSAIYFLAFIVYLEYLFLSNELTYTFLSTNIYFKIFLSIFIVLTNIHGFIGLWTVGTDYLTTRSLGFLSDRLGGVANSVRRLYEILFITMGCLITALYFLIIWF